MLLFFPSFGFVVWRLAGAQVAYLLTVRSNLLSTNEAQVCSQAS